MKLIQPAEISGKIMTLIDQSEQYIIIISPYNKFDNWKKLKNRIEKAQKRGVKISWYIRSKIKGNSEQVKRLGVTPIEIDNLHCKLYLNEKNAVVTSMNLHEYSDNSSIDIGYFISNEEQYKELIEYIRIFIKPSERTTKENIEVSFFKLLESYLTNFSDSYKVMHVEENNINPMISLIGFKDEFELIFEPKKYYFRIDLRIKSTSKKKKETYCYLEGIKNKLEKSIGHEINFGNQMKRLKLDLIISDDYNYQNWSNYQFNKIKPYIFNTIKTYTKEINTFYNLVDNSA